MSAPALPRPSIAAARSPVRKVLLALGIVGPLYYVATDRFVGSRWKGYSFTDQSISELFAIDAPTRPLAVPLFVTYATLAIAFGLGVWGSAGSKRGLRVVAAGLVGKEVTGTIATVITPMHMRGSEGTLTDTMHGSLTLAGALCYLLAMGFGARAIGKRFSIYSIGTMLALAVGGTLASKHIPRLAKDQPTPRMGLWERMNAYGAMLWIAVLAAALLRARREPTRLAPVALPRST